MKKPGFKEYQLISLYLILGGLTVALLILAKWVLFGPTVNLVEMATR